MTYNSRKNNSLYKNPSIIPTCILIVLFFVFGFLSLNSYMKYNDNDYVECDYGFIVIDNYFNNDDKTAIYYYTNNGDYVETVLNETSSEWTPGSILSGKYNPNDLNDVLIFESYIYSGFIFALISIISLLACITIYVKKNKKEKFIQNCKKKGTKVIAKVIDTFESSYSIGHVHSEYLTCRAEYKGQPIIVRSLNSFTHDLCKEFHHFDNASMSFIVNVYFLNEYKYYVDLDTLRVDEIDL